MLQLLKTQLKRIIAEFIKRNENVKETAAGIMYMNGKFYLMVKQDGGSFDLVEEYNPDNDK